MFDDRVFEQLRELFLFDHEERVSLGRSLALLERLDSGWSGFKTGNVELDLLDKRISLSEHLDGERWKRHLFVGGSMGSILSYLWSESELR